MADAGSDNDAPVRASGRSRASDFGSSTRETSQDRATWMLELMKRGRVVFSRLSLTIWDRPGIEFRPYNGAKILQRLCVRNHIKPVARERFLNSALRTPHSELFMFGIQYPVAACPRFPVSFGYCFLSDYSYSISGRHSCMFLTTVAAFLIRFSGFLTNSFFMILPQHSGKSDLALERGV